MTDDKDHEYVPHIVFTRSTARIELREVKADLHQAHHDHTELLIERNNMAEALRVVNARLVEATKERDAANAMRDAWHVRATAHFDRLESCEDALTTARQSRKRIMALVDFFRASADDWKERLHREEAVRVLAEARLVEVTAERDSWRARAKKCEAERELSQSMREDDGR